MDSKKRFTTESLTDDLVVKILSQVPYKSFCRFKCVCKAWLAFSSDPHYCQMLPKIPTGFLLGCESSVQLVGLSPNDEKIDGVLTFLPNYDYLEFVDSCNGLVLCKYKVRYICRFIVCNPATRKWTMLPDIHPDPYGPRCKTILAFDPSWSMQFYVFNYQEKARKSWQCPGIGRLEVFSSDSSTWRLVDNDWRSPIEVDKPHIFIGGVMHVETRRRDILVLEGLEAMSSGILPCGFTIEYPANSYGLANGCFGQSPGSLQCAFSEEGGRSIAVWSLDTYRPCKWSPKHRFSMLDAFEGDYFDRVNRFTCEITEIPHRFTVQDVLGRDYFDRDPFTFCQNAEIYQLYRILAFDMKSEVLFLIDGNANKLFSYNINNGKLSEIQHAPPSWKYYYYVPCHSKLPG